MEIVLARTRYQYESYTDFWKLVELAEFPTCFVDEVDFSRGDTAFVVSPLNGEWRPHVDAHRDDPHNARVVWWCLERPGGSGGIANFVGDIKKMLDSWYFDEVWLSDKYMADRIGDSRIRFVVLGSHKGLGTPKKEDFEYDFSHMSYQTPRRGRIYGEFSDRNIELSPNGWGEERERILMRSRFMLNVHQDDFPMVEPLKLAMAASFAMPVLSESCVDSYPYNRGGNEALIVEVEYDELLGKASLMLKDDYEWWRAMGRRLYSLTTGDFEFGRMVRRAVEDMREPEKGSVDIQ